MDWRKLLTQIKGVTVVVAPIIKAFVPIPFIDTIIGAVVLAEKMGGTGREKMEGALQMLSISKPLITDLLEKQLGVEIPEVIIDTYIAAQTQAHVDLMNAVGLLPKKVVKP